MMIAMNEDGSLPANPISFLEAFTWFFIIPVGVVLMIAVLVYASESVKKSKRERSKVDSLTRISD